MNVEQLSVFVENRFGRLAHITEVLAKANVDIKALSLADMADFGILRLIVDKPDVAYNALREKEITVNRNTVVVVDVENKPGGLNNLLTILKDNKINVEYMYSTATINNRALIIFRFDEPEKAIEVLKKGKAKIIKKQEIQK